MGTERGEILPEEMVESQDAGLGRRGLWSWRDQVGLVFRHGQSLQTTGG
jgi:hypothetical protein